MKASGASTNALASASGLSSTMAMSISSPSFLMRANLPACICSRIAAALFSQRFRSLFALVIQFVVGPSPCSDLPTCYCVVEVFLRPFWGPVPSWPPLFVVWSFVCVFMVRAVLSLPSVCPWCRVSFLLVPGSCLWCFLLCLCFCLRFCGCPFLWPLCASIGVVGLLCVCPLLGCCWLPPLSLVASLPLWLVPCGVLAQCLCWSLPLGIWLLLRRPGCLALMLGVWWCSVVLSSSCLMAAKAFGPVWGLYYPLHHVAGDVAVLCTPTLRYSSADDPGPHGTPLNYTVAIFGKQCGLLRSCPLLSSRRPLFRSWCVCSCVLCLFVPSFSSLNLLCPH